MLKHQLTERTDSNAGTIDKNDETLKDVAHLKVILVKSSVSARI